MSEWANNEELEIFREYLRIPSVHPNIDYGPCVTFLKKQAKNLDLPIAVCYPANEKCPVVIITWKGSEPNLPSIMLNSHMDVAPVDEPRWTHPPFGAEIDECGNIYARGAQDMKCCGTQYLGAIRALKQKGLKLQRTIHVTFVPDEEIGGEFGMKSFVKSKEFKALNVGFELDESCACPYANTVLAFYAERRRYTVELICEGQTGRGSILHQNTAGEKLHYMLNKFTEFRKQEIQKLKDNPKLTLGDTTTVNVTMLQGGLQSDMVPAEMRVTIDIRLALDVDHEELDKQIERWCSEAGGGILVKYHFKGPKIPATRIDSFNPFWLAFESAMKKLELNVQKWVCPGGSDARYIRELNIPALGFMPLPNTPVKRHDHNEFINAEVYLNGINIYKKIIAYLGNAMEVDLNTPRVVMKVIKSNLDKPDYTTAEENTSKSE